MYDPTNKRAQVAFAVDQDFKKRTLPKLFVYTRNGGDLLPAALNQFLGSLDPDHRHSHRADYRATMFCRYLGDVGLDDVEDIRVTLFPHKETAYPTIFVYGEYVRADGLYLKPAICYDRMWFTYEEFAANFQTGASLMEQSYTRAVKGSTWDPTIRLG